MDRGTRHPVAYIMEAADDISYCLSDMEDAIEKKVITEEVLQEEILTEWQSLNHEAHEDDEEFLSEMLERYWKTPENAYFRGFQTFKTKLANRLVDYAASEFLANWDQIAAGTHGESLISPPSREHRALEALKMVAVRNVFRATEVVNNELAGYRAIEGFLDSYSKLLRLSHADFRRLVGGHRSSDRGKGLDVEARLFSKIPRGYLSAYKSALEDGTDWPVSDDVREWFFRAHLIVDWISSMTDDFALRTFQVLRGILVDTRA